MPAAVLGANDGLISTGSLVLGMASAQAPASAILLSGIAGLAAGAFSMAAGEYVSVSSQADAERADTRIEARALREHPLAASYHDDPRSHLGATLVVLTA